MDKKAKLVISLTCCGRVKHNSCGDSLTAWVNTHNFHTTATDLKHLCLHQAKIELTHVCLVDIPKCVNKEFFFGGEEI